MTIEVYAPNVQVSEKLIRSVEKRLLALSHLGEQIGRAEVYFTRDRESGDGAESCKIRLDIFADTIFVHKRGDSFERAANTALRALKRMLTKKTGQRSQPADQ